MVRWQPDPQGRLTQAALALFDERGYDETTVAQIAESAGLTKRTFFRYFADKREVLFTGSQELIERWVDGIQAAPASTAPLAAVSFGLDAVVELFADRHAFARTRARVVSANPELQERELIKLHGLTGALAAALVQRGTPGHAAALAAHAGVTVFQLAFARWVEQDDPTALRGIIDDSLAELRSVLAA